MMRDKKKGNSFTFMAGKKLGCNSKNLFIVKNWHLSLSSNFAKNLEASKL